MAYYCVRLCTNGSCQSLLLQLMSGDQKRRTDFIFQFQLPLGSLRPHAGSDGIAGCCVGGISICLNRFPCSLPHERVLQNPMIVLLWILLNLIGYALEARPSNHVIDHKSCMSKCSSEVLTSEYFASNIGQNCKAVAKECHRSGARRCGQSNIPPICKIGSDSYPDAKDGA